MKTISYYYLGCKVNHYECSAVIQPFLNNGYELSEDDNPDVVIVNTCSVTSVADQKSRQLIRRVRKNNPQSILVVMGCFLQGHADLIKDFDIDIALGTSHRNEIFELVSKFEKDREKITLIDSDVRHFNYEELGSNTLSENVRAYIKIQDGCNNFCSYCLIPYVRGRSRSRDAEDILMEARYLISKGYKEIVVSGIDIGSYGLDSGDVSFNQLIERLLNIKGLERLTISSLEASQIDDEFISLFSRYSNLAKHLHIPLQSGSNKILHDMHRKYETDSFLSKINHIRALVPDIAITTDVIVGFPSETEDDFNESLEFIKKCDFMMIHVFPFSLRKGTPAECISNVVTPEEKKKRSHILLELSKEGFNKFSKSNVGKDALVLVESYDEKKKMYYGHTSNYLPMYIGNKDNIIGQIIKTTYK